MKIRYFFYKVKACCFNILKVKNDNIRGAKQSFSQSGEDLIIKFIFDNLNIQKPTYIDIGAHDPFYLSNTALFYHLGSTGINIEPDPILFQSFLKDRVNDINLNLGISDNSSILDFYIISSPTLNTFSKEEAINYEKQGNYKIESILKVNVEPLDLIIKKYSNGIFPQLLSVDAEGVDEIIIKSIDFDRNFPIVICIETISFSTSGNGIKNMDLINYIVNNGYLHYADTNINSIFVRESFWRKNL
jgi:FkbM family methyltransferase